MKISEALSQARSQLENSGVSNGKLDSLILLTHALCVSKEKVIFNPDLELDLDQQQNFLSLISRRSKREPISHIIGKREFYGRDFIVTSDVLDPRPDSESLIELVLDKYSLKNEKINILEIGSGSGCLTISLLKELKSSKAVVLDISEKALRVCYSNAQSHDVLDDLQLYKSDVFDVESSLSKSDDILNFLPYEDGVLGKFDLIISNPPYIESQEIEKLQTEVKEYEPRMALDGGIDGLDFYRKIADESKDFMTDDAKIILEIGFGQRDDVENIFVEKGFVLEDIKKDLPGVERALCFKIS